MFFRLGCRICVTLKNSTAYTYGIGFSTCIAIHIDQCIFASLHDEQAQLAIYSARCRFSAYVSLEYRGQSTNSEATV
jgi:hypothetical protein